jgi:ferredoxin-NADP reductase
LYFTSLGSFRRKCYEVFLATHIFLQIAGLVLLFFHHRTSRPYVAVSLVIFVVDRIFFRLWLKSSSHPATLTVLDDGETVLLSSNWDVKDRPNALVPRSMEYCWKPNDHIFLTLTSQATKYSLQTYPFTIFSAAPSYTQSAFDIQGSGRPHAWFSILIRAQDDDGFTRALLNHAHQNPNIRIRLDGPYGSTHALRILRESENAIVVAGGSGIAVAYPLIWALLQPNAASSDLEPGHMEPTRKVKLLWITHTTTHRSWLPDDKLQELQDWGLQVLFPAPTSEVGRPDVRKILSNWIEGDCTGIVVSGPEGLVRDVRNTSAELIRGGEQVNVQVEKFGW